MRTLDHAVKYARMRTIRYSCMRVRRVERNQKNLEKITYMATATSRATVILYNNQRLKEEQLNVKNIGQTFGLFPDTIYLTSDHDGTAETPDGMGTFVLWPYCKYKVYGVSLSPIAKDVPSTSSNQHQAGHFQAPSAARPNIRGISKKTRWPPKPPGVGYTKQEWTKNTIMYLMAVCRNFQTSQLY